MRVLLTESDSLTARETITVLGPAGWHLAAMTTGGAPIARFSRWLSATHRAPSSAADPAGYLDELARTVRRSSIDVVLATHEQAYLAARHPELLPWDIPLVRSSAGKFAHVQGKSAFARTCDVLGLPQPAWAPVRQDTDLGAVGFPCWVKAEYATAGRGVRQVSNLAEARHALAELGGIATGIMVQAPAPGRYAQALALFDHGRLVALHCSEQLGRGMGGSAAARVGVAHPEAGRGIVRLGRALEWHGGLTLDYLHVAGQPQFIECNPRTVEPGNASASGVDFPSLTVALTLGEPLPASPVMGRPGVRTRSTAALLLGAAEATGRRRAVAATAWRAIGGRGELRGTREVLTPILRDPPSALPALVIGGAMLARPALSARLARAAVGRYSALDPGA